MVDTRFVEQLREAELSLTQIFLDPNNPRLLGLDGYAGVPEARVAEPGVQTNILRALNSTRIFDLDSLRASIENSGLLPVDRIVVRPISARVEVPLGRFSEERASQDGLEEPADTTQEQFVVVEGNRRIAACKTLLELHQSGQKTLRPEVLASIERPRVLILEQSDAEEARLDQWVIQGVRHISGIRPWGAYQAAKTIEAMVKKLGYTEGEVASALSISIQRVRRSLKVLACLNQMAESEDYAEYSGPELYSYFDEVIKRPAVRNWLGWADDAMIFQNEDRVVEFYSWITPDDELEGRRRISVAEGVRKLDRILEDPSALEVLNTPGQTLDDAVKLAEPDLGPMWTDPLQRAIRALQNVPIGDLESLEADNRALIENLVRLAQRRLDQADSFSA